MNTTTEQSKSSLSLRQLAKAIVALTKKQRDALEKLLDGSLLSNDCIKSLKQSEREFRAGHYSNLRSLKDLRK